MKCASVLFLVPVWRLIRHAGVAFCRSARTDGDTQAAQNLGLRAGAGVQNLPPKVISGEVP